MSTTGSPLNLTLPASGTTGWAGVVNANFTALNTAIAGLLAGGTTGPAGPTGPAGTVGMIFAGQWVSTTTYAVADVVTYNGGSYIAIAASTNKPPDVNTSSWSVLSIPGEAGPAGPTGATGPQGPTGPSGSGGAGSYPILVSQGGTGATTAPAALTALGAAASGANDDITSLAAIVSGSDAVTINPVLIKITDGINSISITPTGISGISALLVAELTSAAVVSCDHYTCATPNSILTLGSYGGSTGIVLVNNGLVVEGPLPACTSGQLGFCGTVVTSATAGGIQAVPATVLGYFEVSIGGTLAKVPYFAA
jgi:hypothetical protein